MFEATDDDYTSLDDYSTLDDFDPLADDDELDEELMLIGATDVAQAQNDQEQELSAPQRIKELFASMPGHESVLFGIIEFCCAPQSGASVDERTAELTRHQYSIYSPVTLRELLEQAGALEYLAPEREDSHQEVIEERLTDGVNDYELEYLEIDEAPQGLWIATEAGIAVVNDHDPQSALAQLLIDDSGLLDIYQGILAACAQEGGCSIKQIDALVEDDPRLKSPRKYGGYFVERLEAVEALSWQGSWVSTELGKSVLEGER